MSRARAWVDEAPWAARCHAQRLLVARPEAADGKKDGNGDEGNGGGENNVEPDVEVGALGDPTNLEETVHEWRMENGEWWNRDGDESIPGMERKMGGFSKERNIED